MRNLVEHVGEVHRTWTESARRRAREFEDIDRSDVFYSREKGDLVAWYEAGLEALLDALRSTPEDVEFWTWWPPQRNVAFLRRRMAHETAIHRWDCEAAYGDPQTIEARLAADGVDELLTVYLQRWARPRGSGETTSIETTDTGDGWRLGIRGDGLSVARPGGAAHARIRGRANDVLLALWGRVPLDELATEGDLAPLRTLLAEADFD